MYDKMFHSIDINDDVFYQGRWNRNLRRAKIIRVDNSESKMLGPICIEFPTGTIQWVNTWELRYISPEEAMLYMLENS